MRSRIAANNSRRTATSAIWKITYREWGTTFAPILINFSRSVARDLRSVESELDLAIKLNTKCLFSPVTHRALLSKRLETLESQGKHAQIMPLRSIHLGNPG
jgi:hypothetical protein